MELLSGQSRQDISVFQTGWTRATFWNFSHVTPAKSGHYLHIKPLDGEFQESNIRQPLSYAASKTINTVGNS